jgi:hypothetical protein
MRRQKDQNKELETNIYRAENSWNTSDKIETKVLQIKNTERAC